MQFAMNIIKSGVYKHYKGNQYEVLFVGRHSETLEEMAVYRALYGEYDIWVRPASMFLEEVLVEKGRVPRFQYIGPKEGVKNVD